MGKSLVSSRRLIGLVKGRWGSAHARGSVAVSPQGVVKNPHVREWWSPLRRTARFVARRQRTGSKVRNPPLASRNDAQRENDLQLFRIRKLTRIEGRAQRHVINFNRSIVRVLRISRELRRHLQGTQPTILQILAVEALSSGLDSPRLRQMARAIEYVSTQKKGQMTWSGNPTGIVPMIFSKPAGRSENYLSRIEQILSERPEGVSTVSLLEKLDAPDTPAMRGRVQSALQLLEQCGLAKKLPMINAGKSVVSVWGHRGNENPLVNYPNAGLRVLERLAAGPENHSSLSLPYRLAGKTEGSPTGLYHRDTITKLLKKFITAKIVRSTKKPYINPLTGVKVWKQEYILAPLGEKLLREYNETSVLPEKLRIILVGKPGKTKNAD